MKTNVIKGKLMRSAYFLLMDESGQGLVEYVVILAVISLATTLGLSSLGKKTNKTISDAEEVFGHEIVFGTDAGILEQEFLNSYDPIVIPETPENEGTMLPAYYAVTVEAQNCRVTVSGADSLNTVSPGTVLTVAAEPYFGYKLPDNFQSSYIVNDDLTISVQAVPKIFRLLALNHENGAEPTCSAADWNNIPFGTSITVTAGAANDNYSFIGWYESNGTLLSTNAAYTFAIDHNTTLEARYQKNSSTVSFVSHGQVLYTFIGDVITQDDFPPDAGPWYGDVFLRWDKTVDEINAALVDGNVTVDALFENVQTSFTVTIENEGNNTSSSRSFTQSQTLTLSAPNIDGKVFAHWKLNGTVVSYHANTTAIVSETCTYTACYSDAPVEPMGTAVINSVSYNASTKKASFVAYLAVPAGATIVKAGLVASNDPAVKDNLTWDNAQYQKSSAAAVGESANVSYTWTKGSINSGDIWYVRPYVIYTYNGVQRTVYGDILTYTAP